MRNENATFSRQFGPPSYTVIIPVRLSDVVVSCGWLAGWLVVFPSSSSAAATVVEWAGVAVFICCFFCHCSWKSPSIPFGVMFFVKIAVPVVVAVMLYFMHSLRSYTHCVP